jgi:hypothetical protein
MSDWMPGPGTAPEVTPDVTSGDESPSFDPAVPTPIGVGVTPTGDGAVDARLERLADADHLPADGHIEVYEDVHRGLRDALSALDAGPAPVPTPSYNNRS